MENPSYRMTSFFYRFFGYKAVALACLFASTISFALVFLFPEKSCSLCRYQRIGYVLAAIFACLLVKNRSRHILRSLQVSLLSILLTATLQGLIHLKALPDICIRDSLHAATLTGYVKSIQHTRSCASNVLTLWHLPLYLYSGALALTLLTITFFKAFNSTKEETNETTSNTQ